MAASTPAGGKAQISALTHTAAGLQFQFQTVPGAVYRLEGTDDLAGGKWTVLVERIEGTGDLLNFIDPAATGQKQYFHRFVRLP